MSLVAKLPSASADPVEHADWIELEAIRSLDGSSSFAEFARYTRMSGTTDSLVDELDREDPHDAGGVQSDGVAISAWGEIERRFRACGGSQSGYPFVLTQGSITLRNGWRSSSYVFQLLLSAFGIQAGPQGTYPSRRFEQLSALAVYNYLGGDDNTAQFYKFGHPREDGTAFRVALTHMCQRMNAGIVNAHAPRINNQQDGGLDVLAWIPFYDRRPGQLIAFGQCAAGQDWREKLFDTSPHTFRELWMLEGWEPAPVRVFLLPRCIPDDQWREANVKGGIVFDRCRIASLVGQFPSKLLDPCVAWTEHVVQRVREAA